MLPPRKPATAKKQKRWRSQKHLTWIRGLVCVMCFAENPIEAAHVRILGGGGMGMKPADYDAVPLCRDCHSLQHNLGERTFWDDYETQRGADVQTLVQSLQNASPCSFEIKKDKQERVDG